VLTKSCNIWKQNDLKFTKLLTWKLLVYLQKLNKYVIYNVIDIKIIKNYLQQYVGKSVRAKCLKFTNLSTQKSLKLLLYL
jgi:hypothetical protein